MTGGIATPDGGALAAIPPPGLPIYTWDVAFRAAGGGMGLFLQRTVQFLETHRVAAILLTIIAVTIAEFIFE